MRKMRVEQTEIDAGKTRAEQAGDDMGKMREEQTGADMRGLRAAQIVAGLCHGGRRLAGIRIIAAAAAAVCVLLLTFPLLKKTLARYLNDAGTSQNAGAAGYMVAVDVRDTDAEVVQNEAWSQERIISLDNRSQTALAYDIVISLEDGDTWPEGLTAILLTGDEERTDGVISGNRCTFADSEWQLDPGEKMQDTYGLKLSTTYDTQPGDYRFSISSVTYQLD